MMDLICVDPARVAYIWPHAKHLIRAAIERTDLSEFDIVEKQVLNGELLLWLAWNGHSIEAAAVTQLLVDVCVIVACGGEHRENWLPLLGKIEQYAKDENCSTMRLFGRKGWERVLDGYKAEFVILQKALS